MQFDGNNQNSLFETKPFDYSTQIVLESGSLPVNLKRKEIRKKDVTCLRKKDTQYHDLNKALDLLIDGPSKAQLSLDEIKSVQSMRNDPQTTRNIAHRRKVSMGGGSMLSPIRGAGSGIMNSQK